MRGGKPWHELQLRLRDLNLEGHEDAPQFSARSETRTDPITLRTAWSVALLLGDTPFRSFKSSTAALCYVNGRLEEIEEAREMANEHQRGWPPLEEPDDLDAGGSE